MACYLYQVYEKKQPGMISISAMLFCLLFFIYADGKGVFSLKTTPSSSYTLEILVFEL